MYTAHDIEKLKQKVAMYKDTLTTLKTGNSIDDYLYKNSEFKGFTTQISNLEGVIEKLNEKQSTQIEAHEQQVKNFSVQITSLNQTVEELNQDISLIINKIANNSSNDFIEHIDAPADTQNLANISTSDVRVGNLIEETTQTKDQTSISSIQHSNGPPSFKQLQNLLTKINSLKEEPPITSHAIQMKYPEEQQFQNTGFPSTGINPNQLYNGRYRNAPITSVIHLSKFSKKQVIPMRVNDNSAQALTTNFSSKNETVREYAEEVNNVALIEVTNEPIEISNEVPNVAPIEVDVESIENSDGVNNVALIEVDNAPITISDEVNNVALIEMDNAPITISDEVNNVALIEMDNVPITILDEVNNVALIEVDNAPITILDEVNNVALIEVDNAPITILDEVNNVALIEMDNAPIEISDEVNDLAVIEAVNAPNETEMKRQQHKNKKPFWLFNFFRKKH
ncbi:hypothetical protein GGGNBK_21140 [Sporosarcina sp. ANT_H38]